MSVSLSANGAGLGGAAMIAVGASKALPVASRLMRGAPASLFLRNLHRDLSEALVPEMELTMRVAVLSAAGRSRAQIVTELGCEDLEVRMCLLRLSRIAKGWE